MKLEVKETTNHPKYGNYFEVMKDGLCIETYYYGGTRTETREQQFEKAKLHFNLLKEAPVTNETIILSEEL